MTVTCSIQTKSVSFSNIFGGLVGNILEQYDNALFGLLAPLLAPLFFPSYDSLTALIITYAMLPFGMLAKPIGSLVFGYVGDTISRKQALFISITGTALATGWMGCIPVYADAGIWAPLSLSGARLLQNFFAAGESFGGAIFILEHSEQKKSNVLSAIYGGSTIFGILAASLLVSWVYANPEIEWLWRVPFWIGFLTALIGIYFRVGAQDPPRQIPIQNQSQPFFSSFWKYRNEIVMVGIVSGFSYTIYSVAFVLMNGYLPLVSQISSTDTLRLNSILLVVDFILIGILALFLRKCDPRKTMMAAAMTTAVLGIPLFLACENADLVTGMTLWSTFVFLGVWYCIPMYTWAQSLVPAEHRYTVLSFGYCAGTQLIGATTSFAGLWLYQWTGSSVAPAMYVTAIALLAAYVLKKSPGTEK